MCKMAKIMLELSKLVAQCFKPTSSPARPAVDHISASRGRLFQGDGLSINVEPENSHTGRPCIPQLPSTGQMLSPLKFYAAPKPGKTSALSSKRSFSSMGRLPREVTTLPAAGTVGFSYRLNPWRRARQSIEGNLATQIHERQRQPSISVAQRLPSTERQSHWPGRENREHRRRGAGSPSQSLVFLATSEPAIPELSSMRTKCARRASGWQPENRKDPSLALSESTSVPFGKLPTASSGNLSPESARKAASARIAKIPPALARYIARAFKPEATI